jgi:hypothetical protein
MFSLDRHSNVGMSFLLIALYSDQEINHEKIDIAEEEFH